MELEFNGYVVRSVTEKDIEGIAALEEMCFAFPMSEQNLNTFLLGENSVSFVCYDTENAQNGNVPCAYGGAICVLDECQILNIATHPSCRGQGFGRLITKALADAAAKKGASYVTLEVRESNAVARHLYETLGFFEVGRIKNYYKKPTEDGLILRLDIDGQGGKA